MADPSSNRPPTPLRRGGGWPLHGWVGLLLVAVFWALNWGLDGLRTHWGFFPLWLGYSLVVDAVCVRRNGDSILTRHPRGWAALFVVSIPSWWLFEGLNERVANWSYLGREQFSQLEYFLLASVSFSTVMPAVFGTAEAMAGTRWMARCAKGPAVAMGSGAPRRMFVAGLVMLALLLAWPRYFFPLLWLSIWFLLEPVNAWLGRPTLLDPLARGDWRPVVALGSGALVCGFFWEMWNYWSYPKWIYHVPFVDFLHVFEMPLLGYGGYVPFALELYALHTLVTGASPGVRLVRDPE